MRDLILTVNFKIDGGSKIRIKRWDFLIWVHKLAKIEITFARIEMKKKL